MLATLCHSPQLAYLRHLSVPCMWHHSLHALFLEYARSASCGMLPSVYIPQPPSPLAWAEFAFCHLLPLRCFNKAHLWHPMLCSLLGCCPKYRHVLHNPGMDVLLASTFSVVVWTPWTCNWMMILSYADCSKASEPSYWATPSQGGQMALWFYLPTSPVALTALFFLCFS